MESMEIKNSFGSAYAGKKVLITGDTGFKGSWLAIWLTELGAEVHGYALPAQTPRDNFIVTGLKNVIHHKDGDIRNIEDLKKFFNKVQPDIAFHLAAQPLVLDSYQNPHYTFETNIMGTVNFFEACRSTQSVRAAINITSDKCYQNNEWIWGYRENDTMGGKDPYSASKGCSELVTSSYTSSFFSHNDSPVVASARAGNVIGGGDWADYRIVPDFFRALEMNQPLKLRYPNATRPWQHVLEPLSGYLLLGSKLLKDGIKYSGGWNFGPVSLTSKTVLDLIREMKWVLGRGEVIIESGEFLHEAGLLKLDISKAVSLLHWGPVLNFKETARFTLEGYIGNDSDIYYSRVQQIREYTKFGRNAKLEYL